MNLKTAINNGEQSGCKNVRECIRSMEIHIEHYANPDKIDIHITDLALAVRDLSVEYNVPEEDVLNWSIKEYRMYAK